MEKSIEIDLILAVIEKQHAATKAPVDSKLVADAIAEVFMNHSSDSIELTLTGLAVVIKVSIKITDDSAGRVSFVT